VDPARVEARVGEQLPLGPERFHNRRRRGEQVVGRRALVRDLEGGLDARFAREQASREPNEWEHLLFADLIEPAPRLAQQFPSSRCCFPAAFRIASTV
jgi:hypothetical protein